MIKITLAIILVRVEILRNLVKISHFQVKIKIFVKVGEKLELQYLFQPFTDN